MSKCFTHARSYRPASKQHPEDATLLEHEALLSVPNALLSAPHEESKQVRCFVTVRPGGLSFRGRCPTTRYISLSTLFVSRIGRQTEATKVPKFPHYPADLFQGFRRCRGTIFSGGTPSQSEPRWRKEGARSAQEPT